MSTLPVTYSAIVLPTPISIVSKMATVLIIFGIYLAGITMYTMRSEQYHFNGSMLWNFLMDRKEEIQQNSTVRRAVSQGVAAAKDNIPSSVPVPLASATQRAQRAIEDRIPESFVGKASTETNIGSFVGSNIVVSTIQSMWTRILAWTHVRGNTLYSRKIFGQ